MMLRRANIIPSGPSCGFYICRPLTDWSWSICIDWVPKLAGIVMLIQKIPDPNDLLLHFRVSELEEARIVELQKKNVGSSVHSGSSCWLNTDKIIITLQVLMKKGLSSETSGTLVGLLLARKYCLHSYSARRGFPHYLIAQKWSQEMQI